MGYHWKILRVNLSEKTVKEEPLPREYVEKYLGGRALVLKYIREEINPAIDPLSEQNKIIIMTGPFSGTPIPCSSKLHAGCKSPATGTVLDSAVGGAFGPELKYAGYDGLIIEGKSETPVYLSIKNNDCTIQDAADLWGLGTQDTEEKFRELMGDLESKALTIGPAGENLSPMACVCSEFYRQMGRGGLGAVFGSKNLKGIAVRGTLDVVQDNIDEFMKRVDEVIDAHGMRLTDNFYYAFGTPSLVPETNKVGILPTRNFQEGSFEGAEGLFREHIDKNLVLHKSCFACPQACGSYAKIGKFANEPEYETISNCGSNLGIDSMEAVIRINHLCDDYGFDTISAGATVSLAMELTERGIYDCGAHFGNQEEAFRLFELMGKHEGIGKDLSLGSKRFAEKYGGSEWAMHVKGLELPGYDPRGSWTQALAYATADRGGCHMRGWPVGDDVLGSLDPYDEEEVLVARVVECQNDNAVCNCIDLCAFSHMEYDEIADFATRTLGFSYTVDDLKKIIDRVLNLSRIFNTQAGLDRKDDTFSERVFNDRLESLSSEKGGKILNKEKFETMKTLLYRHRGWDDNGVPMPERVQELDL